jgi:hypothetical protein
MGKSDRMVETLIPSIVIDEKDARAALLSTLINLPDKASALTIEQIAQQ